MEDPYDIDQSAAEEKLKELQEAFERWRRIRLSKEDEAEVISDPDGSVEDEFRWLTNEMKQSVRSLTWDLDDLAETCQLVNRRSPNEQLLIGRLEFLRDSRALVSAIDSEIRAVKPSEGSFAGQQQQQQQQQQNLSDPIAIEAAVFDSDDELLIPEIRAEIGDFGVSVENELGLRRPLWRRHKLGIGFLACTIALLLLILLLWLAARANRPITHKQDANDA